MTVSVIIVNYNTKNITENCIKSILEYTKNVDFEIILVDNASSDGSKDFFSEFPDICFIESEENIGFGRANNLGAEYANGEFLFFLNSDTLLIENSIAKMVNFFTKNEVHLNIGVLGCILVGKDQEINGFGGSFPTAKSEQAKLWKQLPLVKKLIKTDFQKIYNFEEEYFEIDYVIGADMIMRKSLFDRMQGFYKGFFMYFEETDLQKRISNSGLKNYIQTDTKIIHLEDSSATTIKNYSNRKRIITHTSQVLYLKRNDRKRFYKFVAADFILMTINLFNRKYTAEENFLYFKEGYKSYFLH